MSLCSIPSKQWSKLSIKQVCYFYAKKTNIGGSNQLYHTTQVYSNTNKNDNTSSSTMAFDRKMKGLQRDAAARIHARYNNVEMKEKSNEGTNIYDYDYFQKEIALRLIDRLDDIVRDDGFPLGLNIGSGAGYIHKAICMDDSLTGEGGIGGIRKLVQLDSSYHMLHREQKEFEHERCDTYKMHVDEEEKLPFPDGTFDIVLSSGSLHFVNDLPFLFKEVKRVLKPDGCFMFAMVGGSTIPELRSAMVLAEMERDGGVSTHVGPFVDFADVGQLLTAAGFSLPTVDIDTIHFAFPNAMVLMEHLQRMGEGNACFNRKQRTSLDTFLATAAIYQEMFPLDDQFHDHDTKNDNSNILLSDIQASVQVIYAIGWSPHESQQKPLKRGSATRKVGDIHIDKVETKK